MTSNRYQINKSNFIVEILDDGIPMHYSTIVNRLNEQDETITRKNKQINYLKRVIYNNEPKIFVQAVFNDLEKIK